MPRFISTRTSGVRASLCAAGIMTALAAPSPAAASQSYVVTLKAPGAGTTCEQTIVDVSKQYAISPKHTYTSALCGFSASISKRTVDSLKLDPRVEAVTADGSYSAS